VNAMLEPDIPLDPLGDAEALSKAGVKRNYAKVGSSRPSSLLYTYGPGSVMDLPGFTIMPAGLDDWERIWARRDGHPTIHAPRLLDAVRTLLGSFVDEFRPFPSQPKVMSMSREGEDLGVPARVFPQWLRCTGCGLLGPLSKFEYTNTHPFRPDLARFEHVKCPGRGGRGQRRSPAIPARYLLVCPAGHVDEFPYDLWVHHGEKCAKAEFPVLKMIDRTGGKGASATVVCESCGKRRPMNEAQGESGRKKLPQCRGRHPHLGSFEPGGCQNQTRLMLIGASNLWFAATQNIIVMPQSPAEARADLADRIRVALGDKLAKYASLPDVARDLLEGKVAEAALMSDGELEAIMVEAMKPPLTEEERKERRRNWDPTDLLVPEWQYLQQDPVGPHHDDPSGLMLSPRATSPKLPPQITRVLAIDKLRKVNALVGFTRIDALDRLSDDDREIRIAPLTRDKQPRWTVATEDRGEGVFLQLDEDAVAAWETRAAGSAIWDAHREAHRRNFYRRFSETAADVNPDDRLPGPRYWLLHTLSHVLIREMSMYAGYSAASLSERIYAWPGTVTREPAAGLMIVTTASDSDGTLGGLVRLSEPERLAHVVNSALVRAHRCSSDPVCARRTPHDPEDFLHGAACHACAMASETSCEKANRFLDRRFLINLPGSTLGFFH